MRAGKRIVTAGAFALLVSLGSAPIVSAQAAAGQAAGGQAAGTTKNWKDRDEYDLFMKIRQTNDPKARLALVQTWQDKYPQSDYAAERNAFSMIALSQLASSDAPSRQKLIDKASEILGTDPKNFQANYFITLYGPAAGGATPPADLVSKVETSAHGVIDNSGDTFDPSKKPANVSDADFQKSKGAVMAIAHNALAWAATSKKDNATTETEYKASLQANPEQGNVSAQYGKMLIGEKKYPEGLFEYARAATYDGAGSLPAPTRQQLLDYFNKAYKDFHGSDEGKDQMLAQAKTQALPPEGLQITSQVDLANKQAEAMNARIANDPGFKIWYAVKQNIQEKGDAFFNESVKEFELPGDATPTKTFSGTVVSVDPSKVTIGVEDPTKPDATLEFSQPLPAAAMEKIKVGEKLEFSGIADSYVKEPYTLTFKDPTIPGVQTSAPARKGKAGRKR